MDFYEVLAKVIEILQCEGRTSYRALKRHFDLDDEYLEDLKLELIEVRECAVDRDDKMLIWTGDAEPTSRLTPSIHQGEEAESRFHATLSAVIIFLQREERATYRELRHAFGLDDGLLRDIHMALEFKQLAVDEGGEGLVWTGKTQLNIPSTVSEPSQQTTHDRVEIASPVTPPHIDAPPNESAIASEPVRNVPDAELRQLTVMFCDLADSTKLSQQLVPEDLREVVRAYQETAAAVIERYEGHIAQYLGDGLLVYFGWPQAHENDAERAVYTGLEISEAIATLNTQLKADYDVQLAVRIGIHTGSVVVGEMGGGGRHENLALGETPNIAARLEGLAKPNTVIISPATAQLIQRSLVLEELGPHELKGVAEPTMIYEVVGTRKTDSDEHEKMLSGGFDALVGRDEEIGLLLRRWEQSKERQGQMVLISGEAGLGKSSLVEGLRSHVHKEGYMRIAFRCSPYTANSAMHPVIEHLQRVFDWQRDDTAETRLTKLEQALRHTSLSLEETVPLFASLLSLSVPEDRYPASTLSPQRQRQLTQDALVAWMLEEAERQPVLAVWEDLHWGDPSTLELIGLFIEQTPTVSMLNVLAYRPEFVPPWPTQSHMTPITLNRLERTHIEALVRRLAGGKQLPHEVETHIVTKTDGVPLYVEELTKMLLESDLLQEESEQYILTGPLSSASIPATLQDSLMARLDQIPEVREVAQLGSVLGREFDYEMLRALNAIDEPTLQSGLSELVAHELLYQRGRIPRAKFIFRHVLIRDAAYQSLLRRTRQQYHKQVAQLLEARFRDVVEVQPELVAHHYTEAGLSEQAINYWQRAGERANESSAYPEALSHLTTGLTLLQSLPESLSRHQQELPLQTALGTASQLTKGYSAPEVEIAYRRAHLLCQHLGDTQNVFPVLFGLWRFYNTGANLPLARQLGVELFDLAERRDELPLHVMAHYATGTTYLFMGELRPAHHHLKESIARYTPVQRHSPVFRAGQDPGVTCLVLAALTLWLEGYPDQSLARVHDTLALVSELNHPYTSAYALNFLSMAYQFRRERQIVCGHAESAVSLSTEQGFTHLLAFGTILRAAALMPQGQSEESAVQMRRSLTDWRAAGAELLVPYFLTLMAEGYGGLKQINEGLDTLLEGLEVIARTEEHWWEAELYRVQGELLLLQTTPDVSKAETAFHQALDIARQQHAKSLTLRTAISLARLWQSQGNRQDAHDLLAPVYSWFTEGFDTADLINAKALLDELAEVAS